MLLLPVTALALKLRGFSRVTSRFAERAAREKLKPAQPREATLLRAERIAQLVLAASREGLRPSNCLEQSLTLLWLLDRRGITGQLRIGARKFKGMFEAHAWVELGGVPISDPDETHRHYKPFGSDVASLQAETR